MKKKILFVLSLLFGLMMVNAGLNKFFSYMPMPELTPEQMAILGALGTIKWVLPLTALAEIAAGILIAIPRYRALGAVMIFPVMVGIVAHHAVHDPATLGMPLVLLGINLWALADNREKYLYMVK